jgi:type II secretory pathway pseudopilin PulG
LDSLRLKRSAITVLAVGFAVLLAVLLTGWVLDQRRLARESQGRGKLGQIGLALHNYREDHGTFPPAIIRDANGKPMHSWRVLLLPYLGLEHVFKQYDFEQPWDSPSNLEVAHNYEREVSPWFVSPLATTGRRDVTGYLAVVGKGTAWDEHLSPEQKAAVVDSNKMMVVEIPDGGIRLLEPRDISAEDFASGLRLRLEMNCVNFLTPRERVGTLYEDAIIFRWDEYDFVRTWLKVK